MSTYQITTEVYRNWYWDIFVNTETGEWTIKETHTPTGDVYNNHPEHRAYVTNPGLYSEPITKALTNAGYEYDPKTELIFKVSKGEPKKGRIGVETFTPWDLYKKALETEGVDRILVYGPPGVGKTHEAVTYFKERDIPFEQITATEGDMVAEYRGMWIPRGDAFEWFNGLLIRGWTYNGGEGMPIIVNEVDKFPFECMSILHAILDNPNLASLTLPNGDRVKPGPNFRFIGTMNGIPADLSEALQTRFQVHIEINEPHDSALSILDNDVAAIAKRLIMHADPRQRVNLRQLITFSQIRGNIGDDAAGAMVFGVDRYIDVLGEIRVGADA